MNNFLKRGTPLLSMLILSALMLDFCACYAASEFINTTPPMATSSKRSRATGRQLKEEIGELLADIIQQDLQIVHVKSSIDYDFATSVRALAQGDKKAVWSKVTTQELQTIVEKLKNIKHTAATQLTQLSKDAAFARSLQ